MGKENYAAKSLVRKFRNPGSRPRAVIPPRRSVHLGRLAALGSAASFAAVATLAGVAYSGEAIPAAVIAARLVFGFVATLAAVALLRRPWSVPRREWPATLAITLAWLAVNVCYMASFFYIPVSLSVLIFFTFPVQIALVGPLIARQRPQAVTLAAALLAFSGLGFALGPEFAGLDWRGCALAFAASVAVMATFLLSRRLVVEQDMFTFSFNLHLLCAVTVAAYGAVWGGITLPAQLLASLALLGIGVFYVSAVLLQFAAIRFAGPARASIVFNAEPVLTIALAALLLQETLGPAQFAGAVLVVAGVWLSTRVDHQG